MRHAFVLVLVLVLVLESPALAQDEGFDAMNFHPATDPYGYAMVNGARSLHMWQFHVAAIVNYSNDPLSFKGDAVPARGSDVVRELTALDVVASLGLVKFGNGGLSVGVDLPIVLANNGLRIDNRDLGTHDTGLGDLRTELKATFLDREDDAVGVAARGFLTWPLGREEDFTSDGHVSGGLTAIVEKKIAIVRFGIEVGWQWIDGDAEDVGGVTIDDKLLVGAAIAVEPIEKVSIFAELNHWTRIDNPYDQSETSPLELGGGVKYGGKSLFALAGASAGLNDGVGAPDFRLYGGLGFTF